MTELLQRSRIIGRKLRQKNKTWTHLESRRSVRLACKSHFLD